MECRLPRHVFHHCSLCINTEGEESTSYLLEVILSDFEPIPYETAYISEEEFVFDSLRNELLYAILRDSTRGLLSEATNVDSQERNTP